MRCSYSRFNGKLLLLSIALFNLNNFLFADDVEIDLNTNSAPVSKTTSSLASTPSSTAPSKSDSSKPTPISNSKGEEISGTSDTSGKSTNEDNSMINQINITPEGQGAQVSIEGNNLSTPKLQKISKTKVLLKFSKTKLNIPSKINVKEELIKDIRSSVHGGTAWVVFDVKSFKKGKIEKSDTGFMLLLNLDESDQATALKTDMTLPSKAMDDDKDENQKGLFSRLIDSSTKPLENGIKLVLTSDGPTKYTVRKLLEPEKIIVHFHNSKLEIADKLKVFKANDFELQKGGLLSIEFRQIGPKFSPISEVILTIMPGTIHQIDRDLNQTVITLSAPAVVQKPIEKRGDFNQLISVDLESADLNAVVKTLTAEAGFEVDFVSGPLVGVVTEKFKDVPFKTILADILSPGNYGYDLQGNTLRVGPQTSLKSTKLILPHVTELITPSGGMTPQAFDQMVREILPPTNASNSFPDTTRNVIVLNGTTADIEEYKRAMKDLKLDSEANGNRITRVVKLDYADPTTLSTILTAYLTPVGKVQIAGNRLVIWESATNMGVLLELIKELDTKPPQVLIESNIVEVDDTNDFDLGVVWSGNKNIGDPTLQASVSAPPISGATGILTFGTVKNGFNINASIEAVVTKQKGKVISRPRVATQSGVPAEIQETENVIISTITQNPVPGVGIQTVQTFSQLGLPIDLKVTPRITEDGRITTEINASITSQSGPAPANGPPPTNVQTATTKLNTKNGETIVIGGLVRDVAQDTVNGVPILSSIPIIGSLFQEHQRTSRKEELVIFITPTLLED